MPKRKPASETVIEGAAVPVNPSEPAEYTQYSGRIQRSVEEPASDVAGMTHKAQAAVVPWATDGKLSIEFHPTMVEIAKMKAERAELLEANTVDGRIETSESYDKVKRAYLEIVPLRTACNDRRLEEGRQAREYVKLVNEIGNTVIEALEDIEAPLRAAVKEADERAEKAAMDEARREQEEAARVERERVAKIEAENQRLRDEHAARMKSQQDEIDRQKSELAAERAAQQKLIDEERAENRRKAEEERAAFQVRIDAEREEMERLRKDHQAKLDAQREAQAKIDIENKRIADVRLAAARAEEEKKREEERKKKEAEEADLRREVEAKAAATRASELEVAKKQAAAEALEKAERDRLNAARIAKEEAELAEQDRQRAAAMLPDRQKIHVFVSAITDLKPPSMKTNEGRMVLDKLWSSVSAACYEADEFIKGGK